MKDQIKKLRSYLLLWSTQSLSALGSGMTSYALVLWLYEYSGSALKTALLTVCSYAPYVIMSIFAGALSDKWNKKRTMLLCDLFAAMTTVAAFILIKADALLPWHLYVINALNGLMNTVQQPASEVASTQLIPKEYYQKTSGLRSFSQSLNSLLTPVLATVLFTFGGVSAVMVTDLITFAAAFLVLLLFIPIPEPEGSDKKKEPLLASAKAGLKWLKGCPVVLKLIFFLSGINLIASAYNAALPAMVLSKAASGEKTLGTVNFFAGAAALAGSLIASLSPAPKNRVRAICLALFFSMSTENFMLSFSNSPVIWCIGAVCGWLFIPYMGANLDVILRSTIPADMQGRVYSCRNTLQFFTIPVGYLSGGILIDKVFEPFMSGRAEGSTLVALFGSGKGSGAALLFAVLGFAGVAVCTVFSLLLRKEKV
ncbi:MFS transporter [Ruminococcus flavefaciens]|uniref:Major Facilitator Superfamily protein n=1 Tax=Ruminococcus flavefaciens TaxID=1265 RepID=A0A1M7G664_RUMFL|nr:MFS transporter [Ruminococcus flavefaciens]SHM11568.1 Major Facilitator Superfamily protein [Ruminococcus flavefaciens]